MGREKNSIIYLYCVTNIIPNIKDLYYLDQGVYFVYHQGLYAVVSKVSAEEFTPTNITRSEWLTLKTNLHMKLIEGVMRYSCAVPFGFATLFHTEDTLKAMLEKYKGTLLENLQTLKDKDKLGVMVYWNGKLQKKAILRYLPEHLSSENPVAHPSSAVMSSVLEKKKEALIKDMVNKQLGGFEQDCSRILKQYSLNAQSNTFSPGMVTLKKDTMILSLPGGDEKNKPTPPFQAQAVDKLRARFMSKKCDSVYSGMYPHFNLLHLREKTNIA